MGSGDSSVPEHMLERSIPESDIEDIVRRAIERHTARQIREDGALSGSDVRDIARDVGVPDEDFDVVMREYFKLAPTGQPQRGNAFETMAAAFCQRIRSGIEELVAIAPENYEETLKKEAPQEFLRVSDKKGLFMYKVKIRAVDSSQTKSGLNEQTVSVDIVYVGSVSEEEDFLRASEGYVFEVYAHSVSGERYTTRAAKLRERVALAWSVLCKGRDAFAASTQSLYGSQVTLTQVEITDYFRKEKNTFIRQTVPLEKAVTAMITEGNKKKLYVLLHLAPTAIAKIKEKEGSVRKYLDTLA